MLKKIVIYTIMLSIFPLYLFSGNNIQIIGFTNKVELMQLSKRKRSWKLVNIGDILDKKDKLRTGQQGKALLNFRDYNFSLLNFSLLKVKSVPTDTRNRLILDVKYGKIRVKSVTESSNKNYEVVINTIYSTIKLKGTDVVVDAGIGQPNNIYVFEGDVIVNSKNNPGKPVTLKANQMLKIDANSSDIKPVDIPKEIYKEYNVKAPVPPAPVKPEPKTEPKKEPVPQVTAKTNKKEEKKVVQKPKPRKKPKPKKQAKKKKKKQEKKKEPWCKNPHFEFKFNMDFQYLNVNNTGLMLLAFMPEFGYCKIGLGLYLPIIFPILTPNDFFYSKRWYNHNEWDFMGFSDSLHDLAIKIIYVRYGHKGDPLYARIGSLPSVTLGNGFIMNNYSNMLDFPTVRRIGLEFAYVYNHLVGIELFSSDITKNKLLAYRLMGFPLGWNKSFGLLYKLEIGQTFVIDKEASGSKNKVINWGFDLGLPLVSTPIFNLRYGMDWATYSVYAPDFFGKEEWKGSGNWGFTTGFRGNILIFLYRAEYRYLKDNYISEYFDSFYEVQGMREIKFLSLLNMYTSDSKDVLNGYFADIGLKILNAGAVGACYQEYYNKDNVMQNNKAELYLRVKKGVIPLFYGTASYDKINVVGLTGPRGLFGSLYSENTILTFDGGIKLISIMYIKLFYQKTFYYDSNGDLKSNVTYSLGMNLGF